LSGDHNLRDLVEHWELRLNPLAKSVPAVQPAAHVWNEMAKAKSRLAYVGSQLSRRATLAPSDFASQQALDQARKDVANARADVAEAEANHAAAVAGPTREQRSIANAHVQAAASALAVLERRLDKTTLRAPVDGVVSVIVGEIGENVRAGQPVVAIQEARKQWLSFNAREDLLRGLIAGMIVLTWSFPGSHRAQRSHCDSRHLR
jgi:HlyD family secretion protein